jgi:hypothetical protein
MKKLVMLCSLLIPRILLAQKDTSKAYDYSKTLGAKDQIITKQLCTIDNLKYRKAAKDIDKILIVGDSAILSYKKRLTGQDRILADPATVKSIQNKLSNISKNYKEYLERSEKADKDFVAVWSYYYIDGKLLVDGSKDTIFELYKLKVDSIESLKIDVRTDGTYIGALKTYDIFITTKN